MVTLKQRLKALAPGLTPRAVLEKLAAIQMIDVELPTTDGRTVVLLVKLGYPTPEDDFSAGTSQGWLSAWKCSTRAEGAPPSFKARLRYG